jgi:uncharacterized protein
MPGGSTDILWTLTDENHSYSELCRVLDRDGHLRFAGTVLASEDAIPYELRYEVRTDARYRTEAAVITRVWPAPALEIALARDPDGRWRRGSQPLDGFDDCIDIDLGFSPCTNTLPIRRLELEVGERREIAVLWVLFPEFSLVRGEQTYERIGEDRYLYQSGEFRARLQVNKDGLVLDYESLWTATAVRSKH